MTQVAFHIGIDDRLDYACRLIRKALATSARVLVLADEALIAPLDQALWTHEPSSFVSHAMAGTPGIKASDCQVILAYEVDSAQGPWPVLINMRRDLPVVPPDCEKLIELVSGDEEELVLARKRWKTYTQRGFSLTNHDLRKRAQGSAANSG